MQVRLHRVGGGVFVGRRPPPTLSGPLLEIENSFTVFLGVFTHTPPEGGDNWDLEKQTPSTEQKKQTPSTNQKSTVQTLERGTLGSWLSPGHFGGTLVGFLA